MEEFAKRWRISEPLWQKTFVSGFHFSSGDPHLPFHRRPHPEGDIFGGWLLAHMDLCGATPAFERAQGRCATIAVDGMVFLQPVSVGDEVSIYARIIQTGRTSVRVKVEAWKRARGQPLAGSVRVTDGVFTYVAIGADRKPRPLPTETGPAGVAGVV